MNYYEKMVQNLARLAMNPAWKAEAKRFAQELEDDQSGAYKGIIEATRQRIQSLQQLQKSGG